MGTGWEEEARVVVVMGAGDWEAVAAVGRAGPRVQREGWVVWGWAGMGCEWGKK